jgi:hypothetical protein
VKFPALQCRSRRRCHLTAAQLQSWIAVNMQFPLAHSDSHKASVSVHIQYATNCTSLNVLLQLHFIGTLLFLSFERTVQEKEMQHNCFTTSSYKEVKQIWPWKFKLLAYHIAPLVLPFAAFRTTITSPCSRSRTRIT